ncbi:hypothetical protein ACSS6W_005473 [Trichoderma asperelloides]
MIQNPIAATEANRNGIEYVIKRMDWYWNLSSAVLKESPHDNDGSLAGIRRELEIQVIDLYKTLLLYEIKSVCSYYRSRGLVLLRDIAKLDDWNGDIQTIQSAERIFNDGSNTFADLKMVSNLEKLVTYAETQSASQMTKEDQQCMKDLRLTDPSADKKRIEQTKGGLLRESYRWILDNPDYQRWRYSEESHLLWIKGDPGKGKTMLLCGIIDELDQQSIRSGTVHTIYFFCQATDHHLNNAAAVLRGLMFMLINKQPSLISHLRKKYDQAGAKLFEGSNTWIALSDIFAAILLDPALKSICIVVDALDECVSDLQILLDFIVDTSSIEGRVKWIVSSRNLSQIEERLRRAEQKAKLSLELNAESISNAVDIYIREKVHQLASLKGYDEETCGTIRTYLSDNAHDTFLWVALVYQNLEKSQRWKVLRMLREFPPGLDSLYKRMMDQVLSMDDASDVSLCKQILAIMTSVYRPITLSELGRLIDNSGELSDDIKTLKEIVALCGSFLTIQDDAIYFVHQSAKDHLTSNKEAFSAIFPSGSQETHLAIFSQSIQAMKAILKNNVYGLSYFDYFTSDGMSIPDPDPLITIRYACMYWVDHLCDGNVSRISAGCRNILSDDGAQSPQGKLFEFLQDARRFILYNKPAIETAPLQIYSSALLFSPMKSLIRKAFLHDIPSWIHSRPINEDQWSPCLQTLEGHRGPVDSLIYLDNNQIASASRERKIKIWDTGTGTCIRTIESIPRLCALTSLTNGRIVSGSEDGVIKIWDLTTGECVLTVADQGTTLLSMTSLTGERVATGSKSGIIKIWDLNQSICVQTIEAHNEPIAALASLTDNRIISGSNDTTVKIWDINTGECIQTLKGHVDAVLSVTCSTDGQIASASRDRTIKIWNVATGECVQTLSGHIRAVSSVAYSTDGQIASASDDNTIKIWDATTGICTQTLKKHVLVAKSVIFLGNGQLASGSEDYTIKIWDTRVPINVDARIPESYDKHVASMAMSRDGHVVSGAENGTIRIWDMTTSRCVRVLEGHTYKIASVAFSEDNQLIISGSDDGTVKIWDAATGVCVKTLGTRSAHGRTLGMFLPDGRHVAASINAELKIWDMATWTCVHTLECSGLVTAMAVSSSGQYVASASTDKIIMPASADKTIMLWDTATGVCVEKLKTNGGFIDSLAFSSDTRYIASMSWSGTAKIWDLSTRTCTQTLTIGNPRSRLLFDTRTNSRFHCGLGTFDLDADVVPDSNVAQQVSNIPLAEASPRVCFYGYGIDQNGECIVWDGKPILWFPQEHRVGDCIIKGSTVIVGCRSGRVLILQFSESGPDS